MNSQFQSIGNRKISEEETKEQQLLNLFKQAMLMIHQ